MSGRRFSPLHSLLREALIGALVAVLVLGTITHLRRAPAAALDAVHLDAVHLGAVHVALCLPGDHGAPLSDDPPAQGVPACPDCVTGSQIVLPTGGEGVSAPLVFAKLDLPRVRSLRAEPSLRFVRPPATGPPV